MGRPVALPALPVLDKVFVPNERKAEVRRRLKRARGQVDGIERMLEANRPCREILQQIAAAQEALRAASKIMVRNYMESCVTEGIKAGRSQEIYDEFLDVIYRMVR
jgi:CsoR family transcriptional regulator, copper-sensing transcriptional repressor